MTEQSEATSSEEQTEELIEGTPDQRVQAQLRASACFEELRTVLVKYNCRIVGRFEAPEFVGDLGNKIQLEAQWGVLPNP